MPLVVVLVLVLVLLVVLVLVLVVEDVAPDPPPPAPGSPPVIPKIRLHAGESAIAAREQAMKKRSRRSAIVR